MYADDLKCNPKHGTNDQQYGLFANILADAAILSAAYNSARAVDIATKEWNMAKKYWRIARNWLDHYKDYYAPVEDQEINEALNIPAETPQYNATEGRARTAAMLQFRGQLRKSMRCTSRYCTGLRKDMLANILSAQADALSLAEGLGYRNERAYLESRDDVRFSKMLNTAKRGRDIIADNVSLIKTSAGIYGNLYNQAWEGLAGAGQYLGYAANRNMPSYPTEYLSRTDINLGYTRSAIRGEVRGAIEDTAAASESLMKESF